MAQSEADRAQQQDVSPTARDRSDARLLEVAQPPSIHPVRLSGSKTARPIARRSREVTRPLALRDVGNPEQHAWMDIRVIALDRPSAPRG